MYATRRRSLLSLVPAALSAAAFLLLGPGRTDAQSVGWPGPSYTGAETTPTGSKPESKLWWNDGVWWGCLWSTERQSFTIHALIARNQTWFDTGVAVDTRAKSRADCLWTGAKLYIASHQYTDGLGGPGFPLELYRYSYDPRAHRYSLDVGFPTLIGDAKSETLVIDRDAGGTLWAVWTAGHRVWIAHSLGDDGTWSAPMVHPRSTTSLPEDDIASLVAFQDGRIGVLWSDQGQDAFLFSFHEADAPADVWSPLETVLSGPDVAEDNLCLRAARDGRVFAAIMTNTEDVRLEVRGTDGTWTDHLVTADADDWAHPILVLDEEHRVVHLFGTTPVALGAIHEKTAPMDALAFSAGPGTPVIRDAGHASVGEASTTKQSVNGTTGLIVLASHELFEIYVHHRDRLGGPQPAAPQAVFHADPGQGFQPVTVQFLDASTGAPTSRLWTFGDGATSTQRNPRHTYAQVGLYTVSLRVTNALGTDLSTRTDLVRVDPPPTELVLHPIADGHAFEGQSDSNFAGLNHLRIRGGRESDYRSFLRFFVPPTGSQIVSAELHLTCVDGASSRDSGELFEVDDDWSEPTLTWDDMPTFGASLGDFPPATTGATVDRDVDSAVSTSGTVSFGIRSTDFHSVSYSSRQGVAPPELRLGLAPAFTAEPGFEADRSRGPAPLTVQFFDTSSGRVEGWRWDFGDGVTSDVQNPSHTYARPGRYEPSLTVTSPSGARTFRAATPVDVEPRLPR